MISTQIKKHSAEAYIFRSLKTFKMQLKWQKSSIFKFVAGVHRVQ